MSIQTRDQLREKGYQVTCIYGGCYDINQNGWTHCLSAKEGEALNNADLLHPVVLHDYAKRQGLNLWYTFVEEGIE